MNRDLLPLRRQLVILSLLMVGTFGFRFLPYVLEKTDSWHWALWNASPVLAMFLLAFSRCKNPWIGLGVPLAGFIATDLLLSWVMQAQGIHPGTFVSRLFIYALFILISQLGWLLRRLPKSWTLPERAGAILSVGMLGSFLFFVVTNGLIWLRSTPADGIYYYPQTWEGLVKCFTLALPFFKNQFLGDLAFTALLFGAYALLERRAILAQETNQLPAQA